MALPHFGNRKYLVGFCKYCNKGIYGMEEWRIEQTDWMEQHFKKCVVKIREERLNKLLEK
ncbi:MAG: hypothetical protein SLAVMIC_00606 [uncultured marine phage]|uniref:Uncharacterized protein n=1 Tax=uncultured marine phage TaxID=707152 RepID=A0A8D9C975_9VIRU|nr:MAG: hypothetical protein SLAVMIC_00606 [uncultured marine phage]